MGELIDVDNLGGTFAPTENYRGSEVMALLKQIPTAYDIDKVVAQLDKEAREHIRKSTSPFDLHAGLHLGYLHSIAIVKEGGQNDRN